MSKDCNVSFQYHVGDILIVQSHRPPAPVLRSEFNSQAHTEKKQARDEKWEETCSPLELCLRNPPLPCSDGPDVVDIKLTEELRVDEYKPNQLFAVRVIESPQSLYLPIDRDLVAKIFDPLYDDFSQASFTTADNGYTHETALYTLLSDLQDSVIPRYFGSSTLKLRVGRRPRVVRLILIEWIHGMSMGELDPNAPREERQEIMKQIADAESSVATGNVIHADFCPRNIIIKYEGDQKAPKVVIVDFGWTILGRTRNPENIEEEKRHLPGAPISPLLRWNIALNQQSPFEEWIDWPWQPWLEEQYKVTEASITQEQRNLFPFYDWLLEGKLDNFDSDTFDEWQIIPLGRQTAGNAFDSLT